MPTHKPHTSYHPYQTTHNYNVAKTSNQETLTPPNCSFPKLTISSTNDFVNASIIHHFHSMHKPTISIWPTNLLTAKNVNIPLTSPNTHTAIVGPPSSTPPQRMNSYHNLLSIVPSTLVAFPSSNNGHSPSSSLLSPFSIHSLFKTSINLLIFKVFLLFSLCSPPKSSPLKLRATKSLLPEKHAPCLK